MQKIDREYFINQIDQYSIDHDLPRGDGMRAETQYWGDSTVATKYVYQRIHDILDMNEYGDVAYSLSRLMDELAHNYKVDTGSLIGEEV